MSAAFPLVDLALWSRWLPAALLLLGLPGYLLVGIWLREIDWPSRIVLSFCCGLFAIAVFGILASAIAIPVTPWTSLATLSLLAFLLGRLRLWKEGVRALAAPVARLLPWQQLVVLSSSVVLLLIFLFAFHDFAAPPHVHDASNHSYLTLRVAQLETLSPQRLFAGDPGQPPLLYLVGWHASAALIARVAGVAPYVSVWFLVAMALIAIPISLSFVWRAAKLPSAALVIGTLFVASNQLAPIGALGWGGFGQVLGFLLAAPLFLLLRRLLREPSPALAVCAGLCIAAQFAIHGSEVLVALILLAAFHGGRAPISRRSSACWLLTLLVAAAVIGPSAWELTHAYAQRSSGIGPNAHYGFGDALERLWAAGGKAPGLKLLTMLGVGFAFARADSRRAAWLMLVLATYYIAAGVWQDPLSLRLSTPFYQQPARILYLQVYVLPPLMALPLLALSGFLARRWGARTAKIVPALLLIGFCASAWPGQLNSSRNARRSVPFSASSYRLAASMDELVDSDAIVANFWDDGSTWAMHVSGRRFLQPCSWKLSDAEGSLRPRVEGLLQKPWPPATRRLRAAGVSHVWVSGLAWPDLDAVPASVERFDADPRFEPLGRERDAVLYRVLWDRES